MRLKRNLTLSKYKLGFFLLPSLILHCFSNAVVPPSFDKLTLELVQCLPDNQDLVQIGSTIYYKTQVYGLVHLFS